MSATGKDKGSAESVSQAIAADIQAGLLPAGTWLKQIDLQERYNCSRAEVRRALDNLVLRRFVQNEPNRGYYVFRLEEPRQGELRQIRVILETAAAEGIVRTATPADLDDLTALAQEFERRIHVDTVFAQHEANNAFHLRLYGLCGNSELTGLIAEYRSRGPAAPLTQWKSFERLRQSAAEHFEMIEAIRQGNPLRLHDIIREHIQQKSWADGEKHLADKAGSRNV